MNFKHQKSNNWIFIFTPVLHQRSNVMGKSSKVVWHHSVQVFSNKVPSYYRILRNAWRNFYYLVIAHLHNQCNKDAQTNVFLTYGFQTTRQVTMTTYTVVSRRKSGMGNPALTWVQKGMKWRTPGINGSLRYINTCSATQ